MKIKNPKEHFIEKLKRVNNGQYELIGVFEKTSKITDFKCKKCETVFKKRPANLLSGQGCKCSKKERKIYSLEEAKEMMKKSRNNEYEIIGEFKGTTKKCKIKHLKCGTVFEAFPYMIINESLKECGFCNKNNGYEDEKDYFGKLENFEVIGKWLGSNKKIKIKHLLCGKTFKQLPYKFKKEQKCIHCEKERKKKINEEKFKRKIGKEWEITSEFENSKKTVTITHTKCGRKRTIWLSTLKGEPKCKSCDKINISKKEKELLDFIKEIYKGKIITSDRTEIFPKELDIYLPELKIAFEFNGTYWHSDKKIEKTYHFNKTINCEEKGIKLFHIFEIDWDNNKDAVKEKIKKLFIKEKNDYEKGNIIKKDVNKIIKEIDLNWNDYDYEKDGFKHYYFKSPKKIKNEKGQTIYDAGKRIIIKHLKSTLN